MFLPVTPGMQFMCQTLYLPILGCNFNRSAYLATFSVALSTHLAFNLTIYRKTVVFHRFFYFTLKFCIFVFVLKNFPISKCFSTRLCDKSPNKECLSLDSRNTWPYFLRIMH